MKDDNPVQKEKNENNNPENINNISSPKIEQKVPYFNLLYSPDKNSMNQKFFPSKENYFGIKTSPSNITRSYSPGAHSPILNYYAGLSPGGGNFDCYSPKDEYNNNINNNNFSGKLSPNFNYSPSTIFNVPNSNKDIRNNLQNFKLQNNLNEDDSKTLQEKMAPFVGKTDVNNFLKIGSFPSSMNNLEENKNEHQEEEDEDDDNEETFTLRIDNFDEDFNEMNKQKSIIQSLDANYKTKNSNDIKINSNIFFNNNNNNTNNIINNNNDNNNINNNEQINQNINIQKPININEKQTENNENVQEKEKSKKSLVENIINKKEFKPYIPNKYRNKFMDINNIPNANEGNIFPSYDINNQIGLNQNYINNNSIPNLPPEKIGQYLNINYPHNININKNNKFSLDINTKNDYNNRMVQNDYDNENLYNNFYYNGDNYKISNFKEYKKKDYLKTGEIPSISAADIVTTITANNKTIKRIDPNIYINESIEFLSYNIFPLAKDQAGCRFLQEKLENDPINTAKHFYKAILPFVLPLVKDPFGNYLIQKLCSYLSSEEIKKILEIIAPTILDIGSNSHGTRVIQNLINYLRTEELVTFFLNSIKPYIIPLLKELNGTHIINKFVNDHPECADEINRNIVENCSLLATHRHGCCILQKMLEGPNKKLRNSLINTLIENCFVLIIDQFGNYVIQSILLLNDNKFSSAIAMKICDNVPYYSKHRYSSNVIEKCFDFCGKKERRKLIEKISPPDVISDLIMDEHGNYVVQKALYYAEYKDKEVILNNIRPLIPKIKNTPFGDKLLYRLYSLYPQLNPNMNNNGENNSNDYFDNNNNYYNMNKNKKMKKKGKKKKKNISKNDNNNINNENEENNLNNNNNEVNNNNDMINNNNNVNTNNESNNNVSLNNYYNINNNTINININSNNDNVGNNQISVTNSNLVNNHLEQETVDENNGEPKKKKKKKKGKKKKKKIKESNNDDNPEVNEINKDSNEDKTESNNNDINQNNLDNTEE